MIRIDLQRLLAGCADDSFRQRYPHRHGRAGRRLPAGPASGDTDGCRIDAHHRDRQRVVAGQPAGGGPAPTPRVDTGAGTRARSLRHPECCPPIWPRRLFEPGVSASERRRLSPRCHDRRPESRRHGNGPSDLRRHRSRVRAVDGVVFRSPCCSDSGSRTWARSGTTPSTPAPGCRRSSVGSRRRPTSRSSG